MPPFRQGGVIEGCAKLLIVENIVHKFIIIKIMSSKNDKKYKI
jgi:hypothetical protein